MRVLVTGAFGNIGTSVVEELLVQGHQVRCFDLRTKANERAARRWKGQVDVAWGDLRRLDTVAAALSDQEAVIHLAFAIPKLSATGVDCEDHPHWAREINVGGTQNLLQAAQACERPPKILFTSSLHVFGATQDRLPPRIVGDPVQATDHYSQHKIECERLIQASGLEWAIFRLAATLPLQLRLDAAMFDIPLHNRMEFVHTRDVGLALANAVGSAAVWRRIWLIGGGPAYQFTYGDIVARTLGTLGMDMLPENAFGSAPFSTDWLDTSESQRVLGYQRRTLDDYCQDMVSAWGYRRHLMRWFHPLVRWQLLRRSPYLQKRRPRGTLRVETVEIPS